MSARYVRFVCLCLILLVPQLAHGQVRVRENCGMPNRASYDKKNGVMRFVLANGDVGKCKTDPNPFRGSSGYAKDFSERAEVVVTRPQLRANRVYRITFQHRVLEGYTNGDRNETFFQVKNCPDARVPVMAFLRRDRSAGSRFAFSLAVGSDGHKFITRRDVANTLRPDWISYVITYSTQSPSWIQIKADGAVLLPKTQFSKVGVCKPADSLRLGNYRSGADSSRGRKNTRSVSEYRDVSIVELGR